VRLIVAQRLVRRVCEECRTEAVVDAAMVEELGLDPQRPLSTGAGCRGCNGTGFRGRTALFELMPVSDAIGELVTEGASTQEVRKQARSEGLMTLRESGAQAVRRGITTPAEVLREVAA
jgi:type IV pilus assembly protein PilB